MHAQTRRARIGSRAGRLARLAATATAIALIATGVGAPEAHAYQPGDMVYEGPFIPGVQFNGDLRPAVDPTTGGLVVADRLGHRVTKFDSSGAPVLTIGGDDVQPQLLNSPYAVAVDGQGNIFVADAGHHRVVKFNSSGKQVKSWGGFGNADGQFGNPRGIAADKNGNVYVSEIGNHRIQKFDNDGNWKGTWGKFGAGTLEFKSPHGIGLTPTGDLAIADSGNARIQVLHNDGTFSFAFGSIGDGPGQFDYVASVVTDAEGRFYTSDSDNQRVTVFTPWGALLHQSEFLSPTNLAIDASAGRLYVGGIKNPDEGSSVHVYRSAVAAEFTAGPKTTATAGKAYASTLKTSGFPSVGHFELVAGKLPAGLTIAGGKVVGVPTQPGSYPIVLRADNTVTPSGWGTYTIAIGKASAKVTAKLSTKRPTVGTTRVKVRIRVSAPYTTGLGKTGKVRVYYGKKRVKTYSVSALKKGVIKVRLPKFTKKGKTKVTLRYYGNSQLKSAKRMITVRVR